jgi:UDP-N-acetylmuramoyl-L-alanyl-D-glutamate--2,6-diaminopimelate ligase
MKVKLADILKDIRTEQVQGSINLDLSGLTFDSRKVLPDFLFIAVKGTLSDGHDYVDNAISAGAVAVVCEKWPLQLSAEVTYIRVADSAKALAELASSYYGHPSRKFRLVGITGTNGKTTTITLLHRLFTLLGYKSGCFTTIRNYIGNETVEATHTTPDPVQLNRIMKDMADAGCQYAFMEVSSHSLVQQRVAGLYFAGGIFSNITHDHLDYHKTFDEYLRAKKLFFDNMPAGSFSLINADDRNGRVMIQNTKSAVSYFGVRSMADFKCRIIESHFNGMLLNIDHVEIWTRFIGEFNASNLLAVYACARLLGQDKEEILRVLSTLDTVEGRFQYLQSDKGVTAVVDYAHTPDAILNVLRTINQIRKGDEQVITVIGAGGNRDKTKRPVMAKVAAEMSDLLILTADNPRNEDPVEIINDMKAGLDSKMLEKTIIQPDRRDALKTACLLAQKGDIILVAGKGHETYQEIKGIKHHFSDFEELASLFHLQPNTPN